MNPKNLISSLAIALLFPLTSAAAPSGTGPQPTAIEPAPTDDESTAPDDLHGSASSGALMAAAGPSDPGSATDTGTTSAPATKTKSKSKTGHGKKPKKSAKGSSSKKHGKKGTTASHAKTRSLRVSWTALADLRVAILARGAPRASAVAG